MLKKLVVPASLICLLMAGCDTAGSTGLQANEPQSPGSPSPASSSPTVVPTPTATRSVYHPLAWVQTNEAVCVSLIRSSDPGRAVRLLTSGDLLPLAWPANAESWIDTGSYDRYWIAVGRVGKWTFLWEDNGYDGSLPRIARRLSVGTVFASFYWNVNSDEQFTYASHGRIVRSFDPILDKRNGGVGAPLPAEAGLHWKSAPELSMVRLQSLITRRPLANPDWLRRQGVTFWGSHL